MQLLATSVVLAYAPLLLLLAALWPALYVRHRQPLVAAMKASSGLLLSLRLPHQTAVCVPLVARRFAASFVLSSSMRAFLLAHHRSGRPLCPPCCRCNTLRAGPACTAGRRMAPCWHMPAPALPPSSCSML